MLILAIETSCDETGISIIEGMENAPFGVTILGNALASQIELHAKYGGVFPAMAKRAHAEKFVPILQESLEQAGLLEKTENNISEKQIDEIHELTLKETELAALLIPFLQTHKKPDINYIAVTTGPGLEPALWVGINAAKVLASVWQLPLIPINHMEGHVLVTLLEQKSEAEFSIADIAYPALALLVSGGHTELVVVKNAGEYEKIGQTRDDAIGEAFDKVARMLGLPYPGGPAISKLAAQFRSEGKENPYTLPRPMLHSKDYDFSFSGIKTATLYTVQKETELTEEKKLALACAFEDAAIEVLVKKTRNAIEEFHIQTLIVGGGVAGNTYLQSELRKSVTDVPILFPDKGLSTDNAIMIAIAAHLRIVTNRKEILSPEEAIADGNLSITEGGYKK